MTFTGITWSGLKRNMKMCFSSCSTSCDYINWTTTLLQWSFRLNLFYKLKTGINYRPCSAKTPVLLSCTVMEAPLVICLKLPFKMISFCIVGLSAKLKGVSVMSYIIVKITKKHLSRTLLLGPGVVLSMHCPHLHVWENREFCFWPPSSIVLHFFFLL